MAVELDDLFLIPVIDRYLLYFPLSHFAALVDKQAVSHIHNALHSHTTLPGNLQPIVDQLISTQMPPPGLRTGHLDTPLFLGIIPTRNCNLGCRYCDFADPKQGGRIMDLNLARKSTDAYLNLLAETGKRSADIHFFGGEPFFAPEVVQFVVEYASLRASELGLSVHFEAITNGLYNTSLCKWIADYFDTVILSLDGPADIQEHHRPALNGHSTFATIARNAKILSVGTVDFIVRACVTSETVGRMPEIAAWLAQEFHPSAVCFETLIESALSRASGLVPPSPWEFARQFIEATRILRNYGIETICSTTNMQAIQASFCPIGKDSLIVSPDGLLNACYLLPADWSRNDLNLSFGQVGDNGFEIDYPALQHIRNLSVYNKALCKNCLCRYHCAGGCHVNHNASTLNQYDELCIQTRLITIATLLAEIDQEALTDEWLKDPIAMERSALQTTDCLWNVEPVC